MATKKSLAADVRWRAKALKDWAISTLGNTTKLSFGAKLALRCYGMKGIHGRTFMFMVSDADTILVLHGRIECILVNEDRQGRTTVTLSLANLPYNDMLRLQHAVLVITQESIMNDNTDWMLVSDNFVSGDEREYNDGTRSSTLTIE